MVKRHSSPIGAIAGLMWVAAALPATTLARTPTSQDLPGTLAPVGEPAPVPATSQAGAAGPHCAEPDFVQQVIERVNAERLAHGGLPPLKRVAALDSAAGAHSVNMAERDFFAHCDPDTGKLPFARMQDAGYAFNAAGENIAGGYSTPASVVGGWMSSSGHRANILSVGYREIGVGFHQQAGDAGGIRLDANTDCQVDGTRPGPLYRYWTQNFGRRNAVYPLVIDREAWTTDTTQVDLYLHGSGWAAEMRLRNQGEGWGPWQPFQSTVSWLLDASAPGWQVVEAELRNGSSLRAASDSICLQGSMPDPEGLFSDDFEGAG